MRKMIMLAALAACCSATPATADTITLNSAPADGFNYGTGPGNSGTGNSYTPANAVVNSFAGTGYNPAGDLAIRFHQTGVAANASDANGVYSFALGTPKISFDFSLDGTSLNAGVNTITLVNLLTGASATFDPTLLPDNYLGGGTDADLLQNSEQLGFGFLNGGPGIATGNLGFDPTVNDTYSATLSANGHSVTAYAKVGDGYTPAVPEPATWAMMLLGFGGIGFAMRKTRSQPGLAQLA